MNEPRDPDAIIDPLSPDALGLPTPVLVTDSLVRVGVRVATHFLNEHRADQEHLREGHRLRYEDDLRREDLDRLERMGRTAEASPEQREAAFDLLLDEIARRHRLRRNGATAGEVQL